MNSISYVPIVKAKRNDLAALLDVHSATKGDVRPLIELAGHIVEDVDTEILRLTERLSTFAWVNRPYIDMYAFLPDAKSSNGESATVEAFRRLNNIGIEYIPTYGRQRNDGIWGDLVGVVSNSGGEFCFRVDIEDLDEQSEDTWSDIVERSSELGVGPENLHVVIDLRDVGLKHTSTIIGRVVDFFGFQPLGFKPKQIVVAGSSALRDVTSIPRNDVGIVVRRELKIWAEVQSELAGTRDVAFGDYGVINPDFTQDGPRPNANAKIRYSAGPNTYYFRGTSLRKPPKYQQYHELARRVVRHPKYCGNAYSVGDERIWQCAGGQVGPGNLSTWVRADQNHHFELVARQILELRKDVVAEHPTRISELIEAI